jgi:hypothetical protein
VVRCCAFAKLPFLQLLSLLLRTQGLHISSSSRKRVETLPGSDRRYLLSRLWLVDWSCDLCHLQATRMCGQVSPRSRSCPDLLAAHIVSESQRGQQSVYCFTHHLRGQLFELRALFIVPAKSVHRESQDAAAAVRSCERADTVSRADAERVFRSEEGDKRCGA